MQVYGKPLSRNFCYNAFLNRCALFLIQQNVETVKCDAYVMLYILILCMTKYMNCFSLGVYTVSQKTCQFLSFE